METLSKGREDEKELNDSGCVQDAGPSQIADEEESRPPQLLDFSDDVLLYILKNCSPRDLKALGYTCPRLGRLIRDRSLWQRVDAREEPTGRARLRWLLAHALGSNTTELLLTGYAREAKGCLGHVNRKRKEVEEEQAKREMQLNEDLVLEAEASADIPEDENARNVRLLETYSEPLERLQRVYVESLTRPIELDPEDVVLLDGSCPGPQFTLTQCMLRQLRMQCSLTSLGLQYCNINCNTTGISHFPPTLKKLSLRGAKCYNLPLDKSFLFNIQDYLPELEYLDLSECEWLEPAAFLPLSKVAKLTHLIIRDCYRLSEFVAYASLATRYGFKQLKVLDVRGSPLGDSEISAAGWLVKLEELYASPPLRASPPGAVGTPEVRTDGHDHSHCRDEALPPHTELDEWELQEPEYFKIKPQLVEPMYTRSTTTIEDIEEHIEQLRHYENNICLHGTEYNLCMEGMKRTTYTAPEESANEVRESGNSAPKSNIIIASPLRNSIAHSAQNPPPLVPIPNEPGPSKRMNETNQDVPIKKRKLINRDAVPCSSKSKDEPSTSSKYSKKPRKQLSEDSDSSDDDNVPLKLLCQNAVNEGASTSKSQQNTPRPSRNIRNVNCENPDDESSDRNKEKKYEYIRFRQNMDPVIVRRNSEEVEAEERARENVEGPNLEPEGEEGNADNANTEARPRVPVLYVNVGQQLHTVYRLSIHIEPPIFYSFARNSNLRCRLNVGNVYCPPPTPHLDATSLVTDSAVRRFGRADVDDVNYIHIGPRQGAGEPGARPNRSNLRVLSITGYRNITDRSLVHLATAAPHLRLIDFSETRVTVQGVENFKSLRADCEVKFSPYVEKEQ